MCELSPNGSVVRRTIELKHSAARRASALRWLLLNGVALGALLLDLWRWCGACWPAALWAEAVAAAALAASCARHALQLAPRRAAGAPQPLSPLQRDLLGLTPRDLDGSFVVRTPEGSPRAPPDGPPAEPGSLSPARRWRGADSPPPSPPAPEPPARRSALRAEAAEFICDPTELAAYIRQRRARSCGADGAGAASRCTLAPAPRAHQLATPPGAADARADGPPDEAAAAAPVWRRLRLDPQRLTEYNLNLRLWLHASVLARLARELAAAGGPAAVGALPPDHALAPFLRPFADRRYVAGRIAELARGGCLSAYRWSGGGRGWEERGGRPADAELLLRLLAAYLDALAPAHDFSARHLCASPAAVASRAPAIHRAAASPPHYVLLLAGETVELPPGRNNLLHTLLLFLAALARDAPPALCRLHLGPAGLNMLWILGR